MVELWAKTPDLNVDDDVVLLSLGLQFLQHLKAALRAVVARGVSHHSFPTKVFHRLGDALVICGNDQLVQL